MQKSVENVQEGYIPVTGGLVWYQMVNPGKGIPRIKRRAVTFSMLLYSLLVAFFR